jgi:hypothetical protein
MEPLMETKLPVKIKGSFITAFAWQEIKAGQESFGPAGASALIGFACTDGHIHLFVKIYKMIRYWRSFCT